MLSSLCILLIFLSISLGNSEEIPEIKAPPVDPELLRDWWKAAGQIRMGETAYRAKGVKFKDGVCDVNLNSGIIIPVYTGVAPVSERVVGVVFVGEGELSVRFPERADAWSFANHMTRFAGKDWNEMEPIAQREKPYSVQIDQGLLLSADPRIPKLIYELDPVGGGIYFSEQKDGEADATYVVTERKGKFRAKMIATNILADRSDQLQRIGLDPRAMLRQDRLLHEELNFPGHYVRSVGDYRTKDRYHIAAQGSNLSSMAYDRWMTCYRDGRDEANIGYRSIAFTHGVDTDKRQHFQRFSGNEFLTSNEEEVPRPPTRMEPVFAETTVEFQKTRNRINQQVTVDSLITVKAHGADLQYIALRLPTKGSLRGTWKLDQLTLEDGSPLAWVGLYADLTDNGILSNSPMPLQNSVEDNENVGLEDQDSLRFDIPQTDMGDGETVGQGSEGSGDIESGFGSTDQANQTLNKIEGPEGPANFRLDPNNQTVAQSERMVVKQTEYTYDIMALLPEVIKENETIKIRIKWTATWNFANFSSIDTSGNSVAVRNLGTTTGLYPILPEILPSAGGTRWNFTIKAGTASSIFRPQNVVSSGDTVRSWQDEGLWNWVETEGSNAVNPSVGVGRWEVYEEPPTKGLPGVKVSLFSDTFAKAKLFAPEVRRVLSFFNGFLPSYPQTEVDVFQNRSLLVSETKRLKREESLYGVVQIQTISSTAVGTTSELRDEDSKRAQTQIARQLASQYWGQKMAPNSGRDKWITQALSDAYAAYYIRAAFGQEEYEKRMQAVRNNLENPIEQDVTWKKVDATTRTYSPAGSTRFSDVPEKYRSDYGFYVLSEMLRLRIGNQAFFSALESLVEKDRVNTDMLQQVMEEKSQQDLDDFFDYWIYGGYIPRFTASIRYDENGVFGCVESDIPFGEMALPIRITLPSKQKSIDYFVDIKNGKGSFFIPNEGEDTQITLDPLFLTLAFDRAVQTVTTKTKCPLDPKQ
jgi:hypothetical protein